MNGCEDISTFCPLKVKSEFWAFLLSVNDSRSEQNRLLFLRSGWVLDTQQMFFVFSFFNRHLPHGGNYIWNTLVKFSVTDWWKKSKEQEVHTNKNI